MFYCVFKLILASLCFFPTKEFQASLEAVLVNLRSRNGKCNSFSIELDILLQTLVIQLNH